MKTIRKLYQDHTNVTGHGEKHATQVFGLFLRAVDKMNASQFCDAIDKGPHLAAKPGLHIGCGYTTVLHHVMEETCSNHAGAHANFPQQIGNGKRMADVGFPAGALLPLVLLPGKIKGSGNQGRAFRRALVALFRRWRLLQAVHQPGRQRNTVMLLQPLRRSRHNLSSPLRITTAEDGGARGFQHILWRPGLQIKPNHHAGEGSRMAMP